MKKSPAMSNKKTVRSSAAKRGRKAGLGALGSPQRGAVHALTLLATTSIDGDDVAAASSIFTGMETDSSGGSRSPVPVATPTRKKRRKRRKSSDIKRKKDGMPKRPASAYNLFFKEERARVLAEIKAGNTPILPAESQGKSTLFQFEVVAKAIGERWRNLPESQLSTYKARVAEDKARYAKEMALYRARNAANKRRQREAPDSPLNSGLSVSSNDSPLADFDSGAGSVEATTSAQPLVCSANDETTASSIAGPTEHDRNNQQAQHEQHRRLVEEALARFWRIHRSQGVARKDECESKITGASSDQGPKLSTAHPSLAAASSSDNLLAEPIHFAATTPIDMMQYQSVSYIVSATYHQTAQQQHQMAQVATDMLKRQMLEEQQLLQQKQLVESAHSLGATSYSEGHTAAMQLE